MSDPQGAEAQPTPDVLGTISDEIVRLVKLVRRLELENAALRRELGARPLAA
jgi:hypothetical protein